MKKLIANCVRLRTGRGSDVHDAFKLNAIAGENDQRNDIARR
jgi:hypothetical protein